MQLLPKPPLEAEAVLFSEALAFVQKLHRQFEAGRRRRGGLASGRLREAADILDGLDGVRRVGRVPYLANLPLPGVNGSR